MNSQIFQQGLFLGYISKVNVHRSVVHIPSSTYLKKFIHYGEEFQGGIINSYILVEGEDKGFVGKIVAAEIPEKERLELSTASLKSKDFHPLVQIEILSLFDYQNVDFEKSIIDFPNIGSKVYMASDKFIKRYLEEIELKSSEIKTKGFSKIISPNTNETIDISFQSLFSRHAAIVGTTGSGKSWTTASLVNNLLERKQPVLLLDATGEYKDVANKHCEEEYRVILGKSHVLSYRNLSIQSLFNLLTPAPNAQAPKLKEAIQSLKLLEVDNTNDELEGYIDEDHLGIRTLQKVGKDRNHFLRTLNGSIEEVSRDNCKFDIRGLGQQVQNECVYPSAFPPNAHKFGGADGGSLGHCISLITRIETLISDSYYNKIFDFLNQTGSENDMIHVLNNFIESIKSGENKRGYFLYIDVSNVPFAHRMREIVVDIIGQTLLNYSREDSFKEKPTTVFIDEAHQFLNKSVSVESDIQPLDSFENISKEGRKYGLFLCLTTQLPRDIPIGILSQVGTFITHRLINQRDKDIISHVLPSSNESIINYLPSLVQGEAIISSNELKDTLYIKVSEPQIAPISETPKYQ